MRVAAPQHEIPLLDADWGETNKISGHVCAASIDARGRLCACICIRMGVFVVCVSGTNRGMGSPEPSAEPSAGSGKALQSIHRFETDTKVALDSSVVHARGNAGTGRQPQRQQKADNKKERKKKRKKEKKKKKARPPLQLPSQRPPCHTQPGASRPSRAFRCNGCSRASRAA